MDEKKLAEVESSQRLVATDEAEESLLDRTMSEAAKLSDYDRLPSDQPSSSIPSSSSAQSSSSTPSTSAAQQSSSTSSSSSAQPSSSTPSSSLAQSPASTAQPSSPPQASTPSSAQPPPQTENVPKNLWSKESALVPIPKLKKRVNNDRVVDPAERARVTKQRERFILTASGFIFLLVFGILGSTIFPLVQRAIFTPSEVTAFRQAKANSNWPASKAAMKKALDQSVNAPSPEQFQLMSEYGDSLITHKDYKDALDILNQGSLLAVKDKSANWQTYFEMRKGHCAHLLCLIDPTYKPDIQPLEDALIITQNKVQDPIRTGSMMGTLGRLYSDIGEKKIAKKYFLDADQVFEKLTENQGYHRQIIEDLWRLEMQAAVSDLQKNSKPAATTLATVGNGSQSNDLLVVAFLKDKKFRELTKFLDAAGKSRIQSRSGHERLETLFESLAKVDDGFDGAWKERLAELQEWTKAEPESPIPHMVLANFYNNYGWKARGAGWGRAVDRDNWITFKRRLVLGAEQLHEALKLGPVNPIWFSIAQVNTLGAGTREDDAMYNKMVSIGLKDFPNYMPIYLNKTYYLQPRWRGEVGQWTDFIASEADKIGGSEGDKFYARMVASVTNLSRDKYRRYDPRLLHDRVDRGEAALNKEFANK
jgi:Domain of unknown function (DUF4034)